MRESFAFDAFLSDNSRHHARVQNLVARLRDAGVRVWLDDARHLHHNTYSTSLKLALELSRVWLLCLSPDALHYPLEFQWLGLSYATHMLEGSSQGNHQLLYVLIEDCQWPADLDVTTLFDYRDESETVLASLIDALKKPQDEKDRTLQARREAVVKVRYWVWNAAVSPDSRWVAIPEEKSVAKIDVQSGARLGVFEAHDDDVQGICVTSDGRRLVTGDNSGVIRVWDSKTLQRIWRFKAHDQGITTIVPLAHGRSVLASSRDGRIRVWDVTRGECLKTLESESDPRCLAVSKDSRRAVSGHRDGTIRIWDLNDGRCISFWRGHQDSVGSVQFTPDATRVISGASLLGPWPLDDTCRIWDVSTGTCVAAIGAHKSSVSVTVHPGGRLFATTGFSDMTIRLWDVDDARCLLVIHEDGDYAPYWSSFTPDGRRLIVGTTNAEAYVYSLADSAGLSSLGVDAETALALDTQALEQILVGHIMAICGEANQIFRELTRWDYGIDGEIEFKGKDGLPSGKRIYVQLKSGASYLRTRSRDGRDVFDVKNPRHLDYWVNQPVDVYLVIRDGQERIRWMNVTRYLKERSDKASRQIVFQGDELDPDAVLQVRAERDLDTHGE